MSKIQYSAGFESNNFVVEYSQLVQEGHSGAYITQLPLTGIDATRQLEVWLGSLCKESKVTTDSRVARAQEFLSKNAHRQVSLHELVAITCLEKHYLATLFKRETAQTVLNWHRRRRVELATYLLSHRNSSVLAVAQAVGYRNCTSLERAFHDVVGVSPRTVRHALMEAYRTRSPLLSIVRNLGRDFHNRCRV